jgi:predicted lysophospholipase L1 biosynthesis ABC-type transport system permease subunit
MVSSPHPSACYALAAADRRKDAQVNQFHDHGRVRQHAAMTGSRRQAAAAVAPARWRPSGWAGYAAAGWALVFAVRGVYWALGGTVGLGTLSPGIQQAAVARDRALLAARDVAVLKAVGMSPRQLLAMVMTASAVLGVIGGLVALPLGVRTYHGLMTQLARQVGNRPPPFAFDVLHPTTLYPLGLMGLAVALAGAFFPARRAARSRAGEILRSE